MAFPAIERCAMHAKDSTSFNAAGYLPPLTQPHTRAAQPRSSSGAESSSSSGSGTSGNGMYCSSLPPRFGYGTGTNSTANSTLPPRPNHRAGDASLPPRYGGANGSTSTITRYTNGINGTGAADEITHTRHTVGPIGVTPRQGTGPGSSALANRSSAPLAGHDTNPQGASRPPMTAAMSPPLPATGVFLTATTPVAATAGGILRVNSPSTAHQIHPRSDIGSSRASIAGSGATGAGGDVGSNVPPDGSAAAGGVATPETAPGQVSTSLPDSATQPSTSFYAFLGLGGSVGSLAAEAQAAAEAQQAALRKAVRRDIKRMLAGNRAYVRATTGAATSLSSESLAVLSQPKRRPSPINDVKPPSPDLPDPVEWARWKTEQLAIARLANARRAAEVAAEQREAEERLVEFRQKKAEAKQAKAEAAARAAAEEAAYRSAMCSYVNRRGVLDLEEFKKRREEEEERRALGRSRQAKGLGDHHY